jgi:hypothetical protein
MLQRTLAHIAGHVMRILHLWIPRVIMTRAGDKPLRKSQRLGHGVGETKEWTVSRAKSVQKQILPDTSHDFL